MPARFTFAALLVAGIGLVLFAAGCSTGGGPRAGPYWVCVSNEGSGDVTILDGATRTMVATIPVGKRPRGIHASPDGKVLYVALSGSPAAGGPADRRADGIGVIDLVARKPRRMIRAGVDPGEFAVSLDGSRLFVANGDAETVTVVNTATGVVERVIPVNAEPEGVRFTPDGRLVYVACGARGEVLVLDADDGAVRARFAIGGRPRTIAFLPDGTRAFISSETGELRIVDTQSGRVRANIKLPQGSRPMGVVVRRDGKRIFVSNGRAGTITAHDSKGALLHVVRVGPRPWGLALSPEENLLYVANGPSNSVSVIDLSDYREIMRVPVGEDPWGVEVVRAPEPAP